jgi:hypothetical protein
VFKNTVSKIIFGSKMQEITGGCRKLHDEEFCSVPWLTNWSSFKLEKPYRSAGSKAKRSMLCN